jgi:hypothetical protein
LEEIKTYHRKGDHARLKGLVKKLHRDSQGCAWGLVVGAYNLSLQVLFKNTNDIVPLRKLDVSVLLLNYDYLDIIVQVSMPLNVTPLIFNCQYLKHMVISIFIDIE